MRAIMFFVAACVVCQAGLATPRELAIVKVSKPDFDQATFVADRGVCLTTANCDRLANNRNAGAWARHHLKVFTDCMGAKGYTFDPNGTAAIRYMQDGRLNVYAEAI